MRYSINKNSERGIIVVKTYDQMTAQGFWGLAEDILNGPYHSGSKGVLFDHTQLDFSGAVLEDLERIRAYHLKNEQRIGPGKSAILLASGKGPCWEKLWSQGKRIQTAGKVRVFEDRQKALDWLSNN